MLKLVRFQDTRNQNILLRTHLKTNNVFVLGDPYRVLELKVTLYEKSSEGTFSGHEGVTKYINLINMVE